MDYFASWLLEHLSNFSCSKLSYRMTKHNTVLTILKHLVTVYFEYCSCLRISVIEVVKTALPFRCVFNCYTKIINRY